MNNYILVFTNRSLNTINNEVIYKIIVSLENNKEIIKDQLLNDHSLPYNYNLITEVPTNKDITTLKRYFEKGLEVMKYGENNGYFIFKDIEQLQALLETLALNGYSNNNVVIRPEKIRKQRIDNIDFKRLGIPRGSYLIFQDDNNITCKVHNSKKVMYNDKVYSLTRLTQVLRNDDKPVSGPVHWSYNGKLVSEMNKEQLSKVSQ